jgi:hypothetical protein
MSIAARMPANRSPAFPCDERHHDKPGNRIGPPPAKPCIETETGEKDRREVRADSRLSRLGLERTAPETARYPSLK